MTTFGLAAGASLPTHPSGQSLGDLLDYSLPQRALAVAKFPFTAGVGLPGNYHLPVEKYHLPVPAFIPDLAMARDRSTGWRHFLYKLLSLGWSGTEAEWLPHSQGHRDFRLRHHPGHVFCPYDRILGFCRRMVPGWHSTIFGPYFIVGAILSGVSAVISILFILRRNHGEYEIFYPA